MIAQEWMINVDSGLIVLCVVWVSYLASRMRRVHSIFIGIVHRLGRAAAWRASRCRAAMCILGILCFSVGEMLASPKMNDYLGVIAPEGQKALYMGYANMPTAIGWAIGSFLGGQLYDKMGDKANLALRYLEQHGGVPAGVERTNAMEALQDGHRLDANAATQLLWDTYHPYQVWYPFVAIGLAAAVGIGLYSWWMAKDVHANV